MPRAAFQRIYSDDELAAILHAGCDREPRLKPAAIVAAAKAGELVTPDGRQVAPFTAAPSTVAKYVGEERNRRKTPRHSSEADPKQRAELAYREAWAIVDTDLKRLQRASNRTQRADPIDKRQKQLGEILANVERLSRIGDRLSPRAKPSEHAADAAKSEAEAKAADPVAGLAERARAQDTEQAATPPTTHGPEQSGPLATARTHNEADQRKPGFGSSARDGALVA